MHSMFTRLSLVSLKPFLLLSFINHLFFNAKTCVNLTDKVLQAKQKTTREAFIFSSVLHYLLGRNVKLLGKIVNSW